MLGFMNDIAFHCRCQVSAADGLGHCDIGVINHRLRRTLHNRGGEYIYPVELAVQGSRPAFMDQPDQLQRAGQSVPVTGRRRGLAEGSGRR